MSTSSKGVEGRAGPYGGLGARGRSGSRRGFGLLEALVALVVAGWLLPPLARALGGAWMAARMPMDLVSGMTLARDVAAGMEVPAEARRLGFDAERRSVAAKILILPSDVAPAPPGTGKDDAAGRLRPDATPSAIRLAVPAAPGAAALGDAPPPVALRRVVVVVRTPQGRRLYLDALRLDDAAP